jgi:hypothetical protein
MKWGVRKNPAKAYVKAHKKLRKLQRTAEFKNSTPAWARARYKSRVLGKENAVLYQAYAAHASRKRVEKWVKKMDKAFKDVDPKYIKEGQRLLAEYDKKKAKK